MYMYVLILCIVYMYVYVCINIMYSLYVCICMYMYIGTYMKVWQSTQPGRGGGGVLCKVAADWTTLLLL